MKRVLPALLIPALVNGHRSASHYQCGSENRRHSDARNSSHFSPTEEVAILGETWGLEAPQVVEVLVFLRSLLHNELVTHGQSGRAIGSQDVEVLKNYADWIDRIPDVIVELHEAVLLEDPELVPLVVPECLDASLVPFVSNQRTIAHARQPPEAAEPEAPPQRPRVLRKSSKKNEGRLNNKSGIHSNGFALSPNAKTTHARAHSGYTGRRHD